MQKTSTRTSDETADSDDEGSIVMDPMDMGCGACRTHESKRWWKAPKNFVSEVLCDNCGQNWRKYADLNVRPVREESVPSSKGRAATEKREGSPLAGPNAKRVKVNSFNFRCVELLQMFLAADDYNVRHMAISATRGSAYSLPGLFETGIRRQSVAVFAVSSASPPRYVKVNLARKFCSHLQRILRCGR